MAEGAKKVAAWDFDRIIPCHGGQYYLREGRLTLTNDQMSSRLAERQLGPKCSRDSCDLFSSHGHTQATLYYSMLNELVSRIYSSFILCIWNKTTLQTPTEHTTTEQNA